MPTARLVLKSFRHSCSNGKRSKLVTMSPFFFSDYLLKFVFLLVEVITTFDNSPNFSFFPLSLIHRSVTIFSNSKMYIFLTPQQS